MTKCNREGQPLKFLLEDISAEKRLLEETEYLPNWVAQTSKPVNNLQSSYYFLAEEEPIQMDRKRSSVCLLEALFPIDQVSLQLTM